MSKQDKPKSDPAIGPENGRTLLKRELEKGLASGVSKRSPDQVRSAFRRAREAA